MDDHQLVHCILNSFLIYFNEKYLDTDGMYCQVYQWPDLYVQYQQSIVANIRHVHLTVVYHNDGSHALGLYLVSDAGASVTALSEAFTFEELVTSGVKLKEYVSPEHLRVWSEELPHE